MFYNKPLRVYVTYRSKHMPAQVFDQVQSVNCMDGAFVLRLQDDSTVGIPLDLIEKFEVKPITNKEDSQA